MIIKYPLECAVHGLTNHRRRQEDNRFVCLKCQINAVDKLRYKRKCELLHLKGSKCECCGYAKNSDALCFHHTNPATKNFELCLTNMTKKWDIILIELLKCKLLCLNCHAEIHSKMRLETCGSGLSDLPAKQEATNTRP